MTNQSRLLEYLQLHDGITSLEAFTKLGNTRISSSIFCLRKKGYNIQAIWVDAPNRYGEKTRFKQYFLVK